MAVSSEITQTRPEAIPAPARAAATTAHSLPVTRFPQQAMCQFKGQFNVVLASILHGNIGGGRTG
jgi:hypothetical protein